MSSKDKSRKSSDIDFNVLLDAIKRCLVDKKPTKSTAKMYAIPRTTLQRYVKKITEYFEDIEAADDGALFEFLRECSKRMPSNQVH